MVSPQDPPRSDESIGADDSHGNGPAANPLTAAAALRGSGQLAKADEVCRRALDVEPLDAPLLRLAGAIARDRQDMARASSFLRRALEAGGADPDVLSELGAVLLALGQSAEALEALRAALALDPGHGVAHLHLGLHFTSQGIANHARRHLIEARRFDPANEEAHNALGVLAGLQRDFEAAERHFRDALVQAPGYEAAHRNLANAYLELGRLDDAIACLRALAGYHRGDADAHKMLAQVQRKAGQMSDALTSIHRALALRPADEEALLLLGGLLSAVERYGPAKDAYERVLEHHPESTRAMAGIARCLYNLGRLDEAAPAAARGLAIEPRDVSMNLTAARCHNANRRFDEALGHLARADLDEASHSMRADYSFESGRALDRLDRTDEAFAAYQRANAAARRVKSAAPIDGKKYLDELDTLTSTWSRVAPTEAPARWNAATDNPLFFLVGFPRSGTTLLHMVLEAHASIRVLEERPVFNLMRRELRRRHGIDSVRATAIPDDVMEGARRYYFDLFNRYQPFGPGDVLVDKIPLNSRWMGLIHRVFPEARFIFALRHPYDVCLSCFMQRFQNNEAMANFFTLEGAAEVYARVLRLVEVYRRVLPLEIHTVRYESMIGDHETTVRGLFDFIDVPWDDRVLEFDVHARQRGNIRTPSKTQVVQPIYTHATDRWRRYANHIAPLRDRLHPFVEKLGYEE